MYYTVPITSPGGFATIRISNLTGIDIEHVGIYPREFTIYITEQSNLNHTHFPR
jgi:hypothetical protein